jgi:hypothetical protein
MSVPAVLAGLVVAGHLAFVAFAAAGGLLVLRRPVLAWLHLPALAWAIVVEFTGRTCPLTPLENALRRKAGLDAYSGDFVAQYLFPVLYPEGLTREAQLGLGLALLAVNIGVYALVARRRRRVRAAEDSARS